MKKRMLAAAVLVAALAVLCLAGCGSSASDENYREGLPAWADEAALEAYIETLYPSVYDDFLGTAKDALTPELREKLRHLLNFKFKKHSRYNLPEKRLRMMERQVQRRAQKLLEL